MTPTDLRMRVSAGRAMLNYVQTTGRYDLFGGVNLNLNFPSVVGIARVGDREVEYGYSSGIYTRHVSTFTPIRSLPAQDEIDALGGGKTTRDWEARFELAYERCHGENVTLVGGVAPDRTALLPLRATSPPRVPHRPVAHAGRDPWQRAGDQHPLRAGAAGALRRGGHPRDLWHH